MDDLERLRAERDRYEAALRLIATPTYEFPRPTRGCEACATIAERALAGHDFGPTLTKVENLFYVCPDHERTGGYESCCACGGWAAGDPNRGRLCTEAGNE